MKPNISNLVIKAFEKSSKNKKIKNIYFFFSQLIENEKEKKNWRDSIWSTNSWLTTSEKSNDCLE